jgi:hypothetical protein
MVMKTLKRVSLISSIAVAGFLYISGMHGAVAAPAFAPPAQALISSSHSLNVDAYYNYHGRRYSYRYHGRYYNHRAYRNGRWRYY